MDYLLRAKITTAVSFPVLGKTPVGGAPPPRLLGILHDDNLDTPMFAFKKLKDQKSKSLTTRSQCLLLFAGARRHAAG